MKKLSKSFYAEPTLKVAKELLGKYIVRKIGNKKLEGKIIETEAYIGPRDKASHAYKGKITPRNKAEYLIGGHIYIYLVYGMHWQLNISTSKVGKPECVLIRALDLNLKDLASGPGKLCRYLKLDKSFYAEDLTKSKKIWLEDRGVKVKPSQITATKRIGIDYAGPYWSKIKWRFLLKSEENWSDYITKHSFALDLEKGVFTWNNPRRIAKSLKMSAEASLRRKGTPFQSAMSMLNFYINRAGKNLKPARKRILEKAKIELRKLFKTKQD